MKPSERISKIESKLCPKDFLKGKNYDAWKHVLCRLQAIMIYLDEQAEQSQEKS